MAALSNGLFISGMLADNVKSGFDTDGDGTSDKSDEFIEIRNTSGESVDLSGIELWTDDGDGNRGLVKAFGPGDELGPGERLIVVGEYTGTIDNPNVYEADLSAGVSDGKDFIPDGEAGKMATIYLVDGDSGDYLSLTYGEEKGGAAPETPSDLPDGFPGTTSRGDEIFANDIKNATFYARESPSEGFGVAEPTIPCIAAGAMILTSRGPVAIEELRPGDHLPDHRGRVRTLRAIGRDEVSAAALIALPQLGPIRLSVGADGDLLLSPNHRVLVASPALAMALGLDEALLAAKLLVGAAHHRGWTASKGITYYHLLFDDHGTVAASGLWVESLYLGDQGRAWISQMRSEGRLDEADQAITDSICHTAICAPDLRRFEASTLQDHLPHAVVTASKKKAPPPTAEALACRKVTANEQPAA